MRKMILLNNCNDYGLDRKKPPSMAACKKWWRCRESNPGPKLPFYERLHT